MLEEILRHLHNRFEVSGGQHAGVYTIENGSAVLPFVVPGQYVWIEGSILNDGLHQYPLSGLKDEQFSGTVYALAIPPAVVALSEEIAGWVTSHPTTDMHSESFGGYSYTRVTSTTTGCPASWQDVFRGRLNAWRKL